MKTVKTQSRNGAVNAAKNTTTASDKLVSITLTQDQYDAMAITTTRYGQDDGYEDVAGYIKCAALTICASDLGEMGIKSGRELEAVRQ